MLNGYSYALDMCRSLQVPFVGMMGCRLDISSCRFGERFGLDFAQDGTEARHAPIAMYLGDHFPRLVTDLGKEDWDGIPANVPSSLVAKALVYNSLVERIDRDIEACGGSERQVTVYVLDHGIADKAHRNRPLQSKIVFVGPRPLVRKVLDTAFRFRGPHEFHPICAGRKLIGERIERCDP